MKKFLKDESGQTILEYALIIAVLVLVIIAAIPELRTAVARIFVGTEGILGEAAEEAGLPELQETTP